MSGVRGGRWSALAVLVLARTAIGVEFQSVGAVSPMLIERLKIGNAELGLLVGLFSLPGVVLALPGGVLGARFGDRRVVVTALLLMAAGSTITGVGGTFGAAAAGRFVTAVGAVLLNVVMTKMIADWFAGRELIVAMTAFINAWPAGIGLALFVLPAVAGQWGIAAAFHAATAAAVFGAAAMLFLYRDAPSAALSGSALGIRGLSRREVVLVSLGAMPWAIFNGVFAVVLGFLPGLLVAGGLSVAQAGFLLGVNTILMIVSVQIGGTLAQWAVKPPVIVAIGLLGYTATLACLPYVPPPAALFVLGVLGGLPAGVLVAAPASLLRPASRGPGMGLFYTWYYLGMTVLPPAAGWVQDMAGGGAAIHLAAAATFVTFVCYLVFRLAEGLAPGRAPA